VNIETFVADTGALEPPATEVVYAWASEPGDTPTEAAEELNPRGGNGLVVAVAILAHTAT
jgi:hypothetical protein